MRVLAAMRSFFAMSLCMILLGLVAPLTLYLFVIPWMAIRGPAAKEVGPAWVSQIAYALVFFFKLGGARFEFKGRIDCNEPGVVIMNHQSILDIPPLIHVLNPRLPRFVVRARYAKGIPTVSRAIKFINCIPVDPHKDRAGAVLALHNVARSGINTCVLVYPEGHRSRNGEILPFRPAGMVALLKDSSLPVYTVVNDGLWKLRTLGDTLFALGTVRCKMHVIDRVMSPANPDDLPAFVEERRQNMIQALAKIRAELRDEARA